MGKSRSRVVIGSVIAIAGLALASCGGSSSAEGGRSQSLRISAIPDMDPSDLANREEALADYLAEELDVPVEYVPVADYAASVSLFTTADLDLVFYGGLTGVQARLATEGATVLAQRDIDEHFRSVVIVNTDAGIDAISDVSGLTALEGKRFTFGSESSTSGRLMPEFFMGEAGLDPHADLDGDPGFSGSHDKTIDLIESGSYEAGVLNIAVWESRLEAGTVDTDKVKAIFTTPEYSDYHWIAGPSVDGRLGSGATDSLRDALLGLDGSDADETSLLDLYSAEKIVPAEAADYDRIEEVGRELGLVQ